MFFRSARKRAGGQQVPPEAPSNPLPSRHSWIAAWRWRFAWWVWCSVAASVPVVYFLSAIPFLTLAVELFNLTGRREIYVWTETCYRPVFWLEKHSQLAGLVIAWQQHVILSVFGRSA